MKRTLRFVLPLTMLALIVLPQRAPAPIIYREGEGFSSGDLTDIEIKRNAEEQYKLGQQYEAQGDYKRAGASYRDPRIKAVFAIAPMGEAFDANSFADVQIPVALVAGTADAIAPVKTNIEISLVLTRTGHIVERKVSQGLRIFLTTQQPR